MYFGNFLKSKIQFTYYTVTRFGLGLIWPVHYPRVLVIIWGCARALLAAMLASSAQVRLSLSQT